VEKKRELIRMWKTVSGDRDWAHYILGINASNCRYIGSKKPVYAETFFVVPFEEYMELCALYFSGGAQNVYYRKSYRQGKI